MKNKEEGRRKRRSGRDNNGDNDEGGVSDGVTTEVRDQINSPSAGEGWRELITSHPSTLFFVCCSVHIEYEGKGGQARIHPYVLTGKNCQIGEQGFPLSQLIIHHSRIPAGKLNISWVGKGVLDNQPSCHPAAVVVVIIMPVCVKNERSARKCVQGLYLQDSSSFSSLSPMRSLSEPA